MSDRPAAGPRDHGIDPTLLAELLKQAPARSPVLSPAPARNAPQRRAQRATAPVLRRTVATVALLGGIGLAIAAWLFGGVLTLRALAAIGLVPPPTIGLPWQMELNLLLPWLIPIVFSAIELVGNQTHGWSLRVLFWLLVVIDVGSTWFGLAIGATGRFIPLAGGIQIPTNFSQVLAICLVPAILLTFLPERMFFNLLGILRNVWFEEGAQS